MVMARELYALLTTVAFHLPVDPGDAVIYVRPTLVGEAVNTMPLMHTEQASINSLLMRQKHYFMSMLNIECTCFTALDASINNAFKVFNIPTRQEWHAGVRMLNILDQLSNIHGKHTGP
jgi:hypothetical protein